MGYLVVVLFIVVEIMSVTAAVWNLKAIRVSHDSGVATISSVRGWRMVRRNESPRLFRVFVASQYFYFAVSVLASLSTVFLFVIYFHLL